MSVLTRLRSGARNNSPVAYCDDQVITKPAAGDILPVSKMQVPESYHEAPPAYELETFEAAPPYDHRASDQKERDEKQAHDLDHRNGDISYAVGKAKLHSARTSYKSQVELSVHIPNFRPNVHLDDFDSPQKLLQAVRKDTRFMEWLQKHRPTMHIEILRSINITFGSCIEVPLSIITNLNELGQLLIMSGLDITPRIPNTNRKSGCLMQVVVWSESKGSEYRPLFNFMLAHGADIGIWKEEHGSSLVSVFAFAASTGRFWAVLDLIDYAMKRDRDCIDDASGREKGMAALVSTGDAGSCLAPQPAAIWAWWNISTAPTSSLWIALVPPVASPSSTGRPSRDLNQWENLRYHCANGPLMSSHS